MFSSCFLLLRFLDSRDFSFLSFLSVFPFVSSVDVDVVVEEEEDVVCCFVLISLRIHTIWEFPNKRICCVTAFTISPPFETPWGARLYRA